MKTKIQLLIRLLAVSGMLLSFWTPTAAAASISVTGGTNGPACNSGGYFTPSSVTVNSGDTVTISVPSNDPYAGGVEVHGFPQGSFVVARGGSVTTDPITASMSYYGTWPSTGCMKGSGSITVSAPTPAPSGGSGSSSGSSSPPSAEKPSSPTTPTSTPTSTPAPTSTTPAATTPSATSQATAKPTTMPPNPKNQAITVPAQKSPTFKTVATVGGSALIVLLAGIVAIWRTIIRRRLQASLEPPIMPSSVPPDTAPADASPGSGQDGENTPPNIG